MRRVTVFGMVITLLLVWTGSRSREALAGDPPPLKVIKLQPKTDVKVVGLQPEVDRLLKRIADNRTDTGSDRQDYDTLIEMGERGVPALTNVLTDPKRDFSNRWTSARALGDIGTPDALETLRETLENDRFSMARLAAISALKEAGDRDAIPALITALDDEAMVVRSGAVDALATLGDTTVVPKLIDALDQEDNFYKGKSLWVRRHIVRALGELDSRGSVPKLVELLDDDDSEVGYQAIRSLEKVTRLSFRTPATTKNEFAKDVVPKWKEWWEENKSDYL